MIENIPDNLKKIKICDLSAAANCNFKCKMCFFWRPQKNDGQTMSISDWKKLILQLEEFFGPDLLINISGPGEVLLLKGIEELLLAAGRKFRVSINSNGYVIDDTAAKIITDNIESISISLDGVSARTHDYIRGMPGSYSAAVLAIERLRKKSKTLIITVSTVILDYNLDEVIDLVNWIERSEVNGIIFQAVSLPNNIAYDPMWFKNEFKCLWPQDTEKVRTVMDKLIEYKSQGSKIVNSVKQLECFKEYFLNPQLHIKKLRCEVDNVLKIGSCGDIKICDFSQPIGNVKISPLKEILASELAQEERLKAYECKSPCHLLVNCFHDNGGE